MGGVGRPCSVFPAKNHLLVRSNTNSEIWVATDSTQSHSKILGEVSDDQQTICLRFSKWQTVNCGDVDFRNVASDHSYGLYFSIYIYWIFSKCYHGRRMRLDWQVILIRFILHIFATRLLYLCYRKYVQMKNL